MAGRKMADALVFGLTRGMGGGGGLAPAVDAALQSGVRDKLPQSPAKTGPLSDIHRLKFSETIAKNIRAKPLSDAMNVALDTAISAEPTRRQTPALLQPQNAATGTSINYSPTINITGGDPSARQDLLDMFRQHVDEIAAILDRRAAIRNRVSYR